MRTQLLVYVRWSLISRWKRLLLKYACQGKPLFVYGSNDDRQFREYAKDGAVLWVVASHRDFRPTLVARLDQVERVGHEWRMSVPPGLLSDLKPVGEGRRYNYVVRGGKRSRFYGHNDVSGVLDELAFLGTHGNLVKQPGEAWVPRRHGNMLQRAHRIADATPLENFSRRLDRRSLFISWKHRDVKGRRRENLGVRRHVLEFTRELNRRGMAVWLDELALPDYRPKTADDNLLDLLLRQAMQQCRVLVGVATRHYGCISPDSTVNWTALEWRSKSKRNRALLFVDETPRVRCLEEKRSSCIDPQSAGLLLSGTAEAAAGDFVDWFLPAP